MAFCSGEFKSVREGGLTRSSFPSCHDFEVLQCIVGRVGSGAVYVWGEAVTHGDWLRGELHETLTQAAETALL